MNPSTLPGTLQGIDVSVWQGHIDWPLVAGAGKAFAFARALDGLELDKTFAANWPAMRAVGLARGAYAFHLPTIPGGDQARALLDLVGADLGELPLVLDMETKSAGTTSQAVVDGAHQWIDVLHAARPDRRVMIYGSPGFLNQLPLGDLPSRALLWVAAYALKPAPVKGWPGGAFWQYSGSGRCSGIVGDVDLNIFAGTPQTLYGLVKA